MAGTEAGWTAAGLPDGLIINPETGTITGKPAAPGTYPVTISGPLSLLESEYAWTVDPETGEVTAELIHGTRLYSRER